MKNTIKILTLAIAFMMSINSSLALSTVKLEKYLQKTPLKETSTIAISIKNVKDNTIVYELNSKKLLHPASTLKIFTTYAALDTLGNEYRFRTQFFKDKENNLFIKLGADPLLTSIELKQALKTIKELGHSTFNNLYIDDSIIDKKEFAQGWMWDDDTNPYTPKVSAYNIDKNVIKVNITKTINSDIELEAKTTYPTSILNNLKYSQNTESFDVNRYNWNNPEVVEVEGFVNNTTSFEIPISSLRRYFIHQLAKNIEDLKYIITGTSYASKLLPQDAEMLTEITHPITDVIPQILQNSNNLMAESIFKLAAAQKYVATGTSNLAEELFNDFYNSKGIETKDIIIKDGSGVSRKNLLSTDWATTTLNTLYNQKGFENYKSQMAQPGDGTLSNRLFDLRGDIWLKTGALSNVSTIAGYVNSLDGNIYSVAIYTQNFAQCQKDIKAFENEIINLIYNK